MATAGSKEARQLEQVKRQFDKAYKEMSKETTGKTDSNLTTDEDNDIKYAITKDIEGNDVVVIEGDVFDGKLDDEKPHEYIAEFIATEVGKSHKIIESGQKVYIGEDLPGEFTQSVYTQRLRKKHKNLLYAKNQTAQNLGDLVEIATNRKWDKNKKEKHTVDAKYGFYKYTTQFALPNKNNALYRASLLIRNDANGKKYLYDIMDIKKVGTLHLTSTAQDGHGYHGGQMPPQVSPTENNVPYNDKKVKLSLSDNQGRKLTKEQQKFSLSAPVEEGKTLIAIRNIGEKELRGMISLGGIPVPSIAITNPSKVDHTDFGQISILFDKETINPANEKNEVYDRDIWSSRFPTINYELDSEKANSLYARARKVGRVPYFNPTTFAPQNLEETIDKAGGEAGFVDYYKDDAGIKNFYLTETSSPVQIIKLNEPPKMVHRSTKRGITTTYWCSIKQNI